PPPPGGGGGGGGPYNRGGGGGGPLPPPPGGGGGGGGGGGWFEPPSGGGGRSPHGDPEPARSKFGEQTERRRIRVQEVYEVTDVEARPGPGGQLALGGRVIRPPLRRTGHTPPPGRD